MNTLEDLEDLEDILDTLIFEDEPSIFTENYALDFIETAFQLMEDYMNEHPSAITEPDFNNNLLEEIKDIFFIQMEDHIEANEDVEDDMNDLLEEALIIYITTFHQERSTEQNIDISQNIKNLEMETNHVKKQEIKDKIYKLQNIPQPLQRTNEWYQFRHNLITASNAYKVFESQSAINQIIYEKCQPIKNAEEESKMTNLNTPFHWGQKYEPLSVMIYESLYNTKVGDFGCIQHSKYHFLGASPDGINIDEQSQRYGIMLEIKNVVSREITGIPKKEYWIQMQLQMEVCDLDECDFLETKFVEYADSIHFHEDSHEIEKTSKTKKGERKGIILYFNTSELKAFYLYKPLDITDPEKIDQWEEEMIDLYQSKKMLWIKNIYWKLETLSCILVLRNEDWFKNNIQQLEKVWNIIEKERITGYEHRAPNKKPKKEYKPFVTESKGCLLHVVKVTG
jgi:putative phage-type endonuclease